MLTTNKLEKTITCNWWCTGHRATIYIYITIDKSASQFKSISQHIILWWKSSSRVILPRKAGLRQCHQQIGSSLQQIYTPFTPPSNTCHPALLFYSPKTTRTRRVQPTRLQKNLDPKPQKSQKKGGKSNNLLCSPKILNYYIKLSLWLYLFIYLYFT